MLDGDPSLSPVTSLIPTEQIQKYLEENTELIIAIMEGHNLGKFTEVEIAQLQAKLQHNLTYLAKLADIQPQAQPHSQIPSQFVVQHGHDMLHSPVSHISRQPPDPSTVNLPFYMNDHQQQQQQQQQPQPDLSTSNLPFQLIDQQQQRHMQQAFVQQQQLIQGPTSCFLGTNSGIYHQGSQTPLGINLSDTPQSNQIGLDASPGWSVGWSPFGRTSGNGRP